MLYILMVEKDAFPSYQKALNANQQVFKSALESLHPQRFLAWF